jgi:hypothetical protein
MIYGLLWHIALLLRKKTEHILASCYTNMCIFWELPADAHKALNCRLFLLLLLLLLPVPEVLSKIAFTATVENWKMQNIGSSSSLQKL